MECMKSVQTVLDDYTQSGILAIGISKTKRNHNQHK